MHVGWRFVSQYDLTIQHHPSTKHAYADGLSRGPCKQCGHCDIESSDDVECDAGEEQLTSCKDDNPAVRVAVIQPSLSNNELRDAQMADATMKWLLVAKGEGK